MLWLPIANTFELKGMPAGTTIEEASTNGKAGNEVPVCHCLLPIPFGTWQSDYFSMGLRISASYTVPNTEIRCTRESIDCIAPDGKVASRTRIWNDDWAPTYPKEGSTRCGTATMIDEAMLVAAQRRFGRNLAWVASLRIWDRKTEYGEYAESRRTTFVLD
jgi:hypothetical protein